MNCKSCGEPAVSAFRTTDAWKRERTRRFEEMADPPAASMEKLMFQLFQDQMRSLNEVHPTCAGHKNTVTAELCRTFCLGPESMTAGVLERVPDDEFVVLCVLSR